jgi:transposase
MAIDPNNVAQDTATLRGIVRSLMLDCTAQERRIRQLQHMLEQLLGARCGPGREQLNGNQLFLFAAEILKSDTKYSEPKERPDSDRPKGEGHGRQQLPKLLKRQRIVFDLAEHEKHCPACQDQLTRIGEDISERLEYVPASMVVEEVCQKYACEDGCMIVTAEKPMAPIEKDLPGPRLLAHLVAS